MTTIDHFLDAPPEAVHRPRRYKGQHRAARTPIRYVALLAVGFGLMIGAAAMWVGLAVATPDAVVAPRSQPTPMPGPAWVEPSHPVGTGESLRLRDGVTR
jgi:hypothetical protein